MKKLFVVTAILLASAAASAQAVDSLAASESKAVTGPVAGNGVVTINQAGNSPLTAAQVTQYSDSKLRVNTASTPGTVIGNVAHANGGCPATEGEAIGVAIANAANTRAVELSGCMANQFFDRVGTLELNVDGSWTWQSRMRLEAWCSFKLYQKIIESTRKADGVVMYECEATRAARVNAEGAGERPLAAQPKPYQAGG